MSLKEREKEISFSPNFSKKDWNDSWESTDKLLLLAKNEDREMYETMVIGIFNDPKSSHAKKIKNISGITTLLVTKENFYRLLKTRKKDFVKVFDLVSLSVGPKEFRMLLKEAYFKLKKKARR